MGQWTITILLIVSILAYTGIGLTSIGLGVFRRKWPTTARVLLGVGGVMLIAVVALYFLAFANF